VNLDLLNSRKKLEKKNLKISKEEIEVIFNKFGLKDCYFKKKNDKTLCHSVFQLTEHKKITTDWDVLKPEPTFYVEDKVYPIVGFFDFLFSNLKPEAQDEIRNLYIKFSSNKSNFVLQVCNKLMNKTDEKARETISPFVEVKEIKVLKKEIFTAKIVVETKDNKEEYEIISTGNWFSQLKIKPKGNFSNMSFFDSILKDVESNFDSNNYVFPKKVYDDSISHFSKGLIMQLILEKYETTKECKMRLLYEPDFIKEWKKNYE
jgi:hypothetical protein